MSPLVPLLCALILARQQPAPAQVTRGPADAVRVSARIADERLVVGDEHELVLEVDWAGASAGKSGVPAPILQIDVPPSVKLVGRELTSYEQLKQNEFLMEPWERLVDA